MTARQVHSCSARDWKIPRSYPGGITIRGCCSAGSRLKDLDLDSLRKFAGLAAKIRHNGIRDKLPLTFRLMSVAKLEIEVFAAYAEDCAQNGVRFAAAVDDKIAGSSLSWGSACVWTISISACFGTWHATSRRSRR